LEGSASTQKNLNFLATKQDTKKMAASDPNAFSPGLEGPRRGAQQKVKSLTKLGGEALNLDEDDSELELEDRRGQKGRGTAAHLQKGWLSEEEGMSESSSEELLMWEVEPKQIKASQKGSISRANTGKGRTKGPKGTDASKLAWAQLERDESKPPALSLPEFILSAEGTTEAEVKENLAIWRASLDVGQPFRETEKKPAPEQPPKHLERAREVWGTLEPVIIRKGCPAPEGSIEEPLTADQVSWLAKYSKSIDVGVSEAGARQRLPFNKAGWQALGRDVVQGPSLQEFVHKLQTGKGVRSLEGEVGRTVWQAGDEFEAGTHSLASFAEVGERGKTYTFPLMDMLDGDDHSKFWAGSKEWEQGGWGPRTEEQRRALRAIATSRYKLTPQADIPLVLTVYPRIRASEFVESALKFCDLWLDPLRCLAPSEFRNGHAYWRVSPSASTLDSAVILANFDLPQPSLSPAQLAGFPGGLHALAAAHYVEDPSVDGGVCVLHA
jgi:hypothetical protein